MLSESLLALRYMVSLSNPSMKLNINTSSKTTQQLYRTVIFSFNVSRNVSSPFVVMDFIPGESNINYLNSNDSLPKIGFYNEDQNLVFTQDYQNINILPSPTPGFTRNVAMGKNGMMLNMTPGKYYVVMIGTNSATTYPKYLSSGIAVPIEAYDSITIQQFGNEFNLPSNLNGIRSKSSNNEKNVDVAYLPQMSNMDGQSMF